MKIDSNQILLISVKPQYAKKILNGEKTIELRKTAPSKIKNGTILLIYVTSPIKQLWGYCQIENIIKDTPLELWNKVEKDACITKNDFFEYFKNYENGYGIVIKNIKNIKPIELQNLKLNLSGFYPPQTYCYIDKFDLQNSGLKVLN